MKQQDKAGVGRLDARAPTPSKARQKTVETVDQFARRTGQAPGQRPRTPLSAIKFSSKTRSVNALRFALRLSDAFWVSAIILLTLWNGYVGSGNKEFIAPLAAGLSGTIGFFVALYLIKAHQFSPVETYGQHMKKVGLGAAAALGVRTVCTHVVHKL